MCRTCRRMFPNAQAQQQHYQTVHYRAAYRDSVRPARNSRRPRSGRNRRSRYNRRAERTLDPRTETNLPSMNERFTGFTSTGFPSGCYDGTPASQAIRATLPKSLGTTEIGHNWALRALHPCDDARAGGVAIPDNEQAEVAHVEARIDEMIGPLYLGDGDELYDLQIIVLPTLDIPVAYRTKTPTSNWTFWQPVAAVGSGMNYGSLTPAPDASKPIRINATPDLCENATGFRQTFKGVTVVMNASALNNQGVVTSGQWVDALEKDSVYYQDAGPGESNNRIEAIVIGDCPATISQLIQKVPNAGQWEARKGCYMPMRFVQDTHLYSHDESSELVVADDVKFLQPTGVPILIRNGTTNTIGTTQASIHVGQTADIATCTGTINQQVGTIFFTGVHKSASFVLKMREGASIEPERSSPLVTAVGRPAPEDTVALRNVTNISRTLPLSYEAKYNALGLILPLIAKAAAMVLPSVMPWAVSKLNALGRAPRPRAVNTAQYIQEDVE